MHEVSGFEAMVALFDSTITFHARYQQRRDVATLVDLLVLDGDNPRSLAWVALTLRKRIAKLAGSAPNKLTALSYELPDPDSLDARGPVRPGPGRPLRGAGGPVPCLRGGGLPRVGRDRHALLHADLRIGPLGRRLRAQPAGPIVQASGTS